MPYIDKTFYADTYKGTPISDSDTFNRMAERASDVVDQITGYKIQDINLLSPFQQLLVKKAVASQVEYMYINGGELSVHGNGGLTSVKVGNFNYSENGSESHISPTVLNYLKTTGLLYRGVSVCGSSYS